MLSNSVSDKTLSSSPLAKLAQHAIKTKLKIGNGAARKTRRKNGSELFRKVRLAKHSLANVMENMTDKRDIRKVSDKATTFFCLYGNPTET